MKTAHATRNHHDGTIAELKDEVVSFKEELADNLSSAVDHGGRIARTASAAARSALRDARDSGAKLAHQTADRAREVVVARPLTAIGLAALAGAMLAGGWILMRGRTGP